MEVSESEHNTQFSQDPSVLHQLNNALNKSAIVGITDKNGTIIYVNEAFCKISKYSREELVGQNHRILKSGYHSPEFYQGMWNAISQGKVWKGEIKNKSKDGTYYWVKTTITPFFNNNGEVFKYIAIRTDITDRKMTEEKLQKTLDELEITEQKYRHIFENSPNMLRIINTDGIILDCNKSYAKKIGYSEKEIIGKSVLEHVSEKSVDAMYNFDSTLKRNERVFNRDIWFKRKDGSTFPTLLGATVMYNPKGEVIGNTTIIIDITEIYNAQKQIEAHREIIKQQFIEIKKIDIQKDEFISVVAHELKTPLTAILMHCDMLKMTDMPERLTSSQIEEIDSIYRNGELLANEIEGLLDVQKLEMGKMKFDIDEVRVDGFLLDIIKDFMSIADKKRIKLVNSTKGKITIKSDRYRLSQVFNNLINNAISFVPQGTGRIEIGANEDGNDVIFYVIDNGSGIPQEKQKDIFKKFYQVDASASRTHMGTGLGLSICKGIVEGLGGKIWFESKEGKGTSFYFSISGGTE